MIRTRCRSLMVAALTLAIGAPALAQAGYGQGRGRGGGGQGAFPPGRFGAPRAGQGRRDPLVTHVLELIYRIDVRNHLGLSLKQKNALDQYQEQTRQAINAKMTQMAQDLGLNNRRRGGPPAQQGDPNAQDSNGQQTQQQAIQKLQDQRTTLQNQANQ